MSPRKRLQDLFSLHHKAGAQVAENVNPTTAQHRNVLRDNTAVSPAVLGPVRPFRRNMVGVQRCPARPFATVPAWLVLRCAPCIEPAALPWLADQSSATPQLATPARAAAAAVLSSPRRAHTVGVRPALAPFGGPPGAAPATLTASLALARFAAPPVTLQRTGPSSAPSYGQVV